METILAVIAAVLFFVAAFLEFFEVRLWSLKIERRRGDISAFISGTIFGLLGLIALLFSVGIL